MLNDLLFSHKIVVPLLYLHAMWVILYSLVMAQDQLTLWSLNSFGY